MNKYIAKNESDLPAIAADIASKLSGGEVIGLIGQLGAGKTTLVKAIVAALGSNAKVKSPTFAIMNEYPVAGHATIKKVQHLDLYRFENPVELEALASGDWPQSAVTFIEWPDMFEERAFPMRGEIRINVLPDQTREIEFII